MFDSYNCLYWQITQRMKNVLRRVCYLVCAQRGFFHIMWSLILPQMFLSRSKTDSLMAHCSVKMINGVNQNEWYLKKKKQMETTQTQAYNFMMCRSTQTCVASQTLHECGGKNIGEDENSLAVNLTAPPLSAVSQTQPNILFSLSLSFLIASLLSKLESYFFLYAIIPTDPCHNFKKHKLKTWTENVHHAAAHNHNVSMTVPVWCIIHCKIPKAVPTHWIHF